MDQDEIEGLVVTCDWPGCEQPASCTRADEGVELMLCEEHARPELRAQRPHVFATLRLQKRLAAARDRPSGHRGKR